MIMPALTLSTGLTAVQMRHMRSSLLEVLQQEYVSTARAKGLGPQAVVLGHALRNAMLPVVTILGLEMGSVIGGVVVLENDLLHPRHGPTDRGLDPVSRLSHVQALVLAPGGDRPGGELVADLTYGVLDPRVRHGVRAQA